MRRIRQVANRHARPGAARKDKAAKEKKYTMKGVVFSEFIDFVEETFSAEVVDDIIEVSDLPSGGAYTTVGTYDHRELLKLVAALSERSSIPIPVLVRSFGKHLFGRLTLAYPRFLDGIETSFEFLQRVENHIHVEVLKLYPDAELPHFECEASQPGRLSMIYRSQRPLADLAEGLMEGCAEHFSERIRIERENLADEPHSAVHFLLTHPE